MSTFARLLALTCCFVSAGVSADQVPARGMLLVATDEVRGPAFAQTVVLLLQHDETGTLGLVVNRPIDSAAVEVLRQHEDLSAYHGTFYWGGPLLQSTLRALLRVDTPPDGAVQVFDNVHLVNIDEALLADTSDAAILRLFVGYAGWAPGQLEYELGFDSWHVLPATEENVFAEDTGDIWRKLMPPKSYRAAADMTGSGRYALINWTPHIGRSSCSGNFYCWRSLASSMSGHRQVPGTDCDSTDHVMQLHKRRVLLSWSSGKDSAWCLYVLNQQTDVEVVGLLTTLNESADRVAMHAVRKTLASRHTWPALIHVNALQNLPAGCTTGNC